MIDMSVIQVWAQEGDKMVLKFECPYVEYEKAARYKRWLKRGEGYKYVTIEYKQIK